jgi:hypothetical protein
MCSENDTSPSSSSRCNVPRKPRLARTSIHTWRAERMGNLVPVRTLPTGGENPDQQTDRGTRTTSANRGSDRPADVPNLQPEADAR